MSFSETDPDTDTTPERLTWEPEQIEEEPEPPELPDEEED